MGLSSPGLIAGELLGPLSAAFVDDSMTVEWSRRPTASFRGSRCHKAFYK